MRYQGQKQLSFFKIASDAKFPTQMRKGDVGYDLYANERIELKPNEIRLVGTGIGVVIPEGYAGIIKDRSGHASKGLHILGGVIDQNYRGEVKVIIANFGQTTYTIEKHERIAQLLVVRIFDGNARYFSTPINEETERGSDGFGSSGKF